MATTQLVISGGVAPYTISVKKYGDATERFVSYSGTTLTFNADSSLNTPYNYIIEISDSNDCEVVSSTLLHCPYNCGTLPVISGIEVECNELSAELTFTYTSDTPVQVGLGNDFHGDWYWQPHPAGTHTITNSIPNTLSTVIQVYKQDTELSCKTIQVVNPDCVEECTFSFTTNTPACSGDNTYANVLITASTAYWTPFIYESSQMSTNRFVSRTGNLVQFTPISDGLSHTYVINVKQLDEEGEETGCEFSRSVTLICGTEGIQCPILDIVFCLDDSISVEVLSGSTLLKNGVKNIVDFLTPSITNGNVKIGIVKFGNMATKVLDLSSNISQIKSGVDSLTFFGQTNICNGLQVSDTVLRNNIYSRDCDKILLLVTDGSPSKRCDGTDGTISLMQTETINAANTIKSTPYVGTTGSFNIKIMCVGITSSAIESFLQQLSTTPSDTTVVSTFPQFASIAEDIAQDLCT